MDPLPRPESEVDAPLTTEADRISYLRARGVEVDLAEERGRPKKTAPLPSAGSGCSFTFVLIPADEHTAVSEESAGEAFGSDALKSLLAPRFADNASLDDDVVSRETAGRLKNMVASGGAGVLKAPSASTMAAMAAGGACEAYPLALATQDNGWRCVRLYIDEIGALRGRPRNVRAEALASAAGLTGLAIHGDAFVGRCIRAGDFYSAGGETNADFRLPELAHDAAWALAARREHSAAAQRANHRDEETFASGDAGLYAWSQTDEEVEVRVRGAPEGKGAARRVAVSYGKGSSLKVTFDGKEALSLARLFDSVLPDGCAWTLDASDAVCTLEKASKRPWATLCLEAR